MCVRVPCVCVCVSVYVFGYVSPLALVSYLPCSYRLCVCVCVFVHTIELTVHMICDNSYSVLILSYALLVCSVLQHVCMLMWLHVYYTEYVLIYYIYIYR